jgi:hypothetical protein
MKLVAITASTCYGGSNPGVVLAGMRQRYEVVFEIIERLVIGATYNAMGMWWSHPNIESIKLGLLQAQVLVEKHGSDVPYPGAYAYCRKAKTSKKVYDVHRI